MVILCMVYNFIGCAWAENGDLFFPYQNIPVGSCPEIVAIGDVNGDGRSDVVIATSFYFDTENDYKLFVFPQGEFGELMPAIKLSIPQCNYVARPNSIAVGDLNGDGRNDVAIGLAGKGIQIFYQNADGKLDSTGFVSTKNSSEIKLVKLNHDRRMDLVSVGRDIEGYLQVSSELKQIILMKNVYKEYYDNDFGVGNLGKGALNDIVTVSYNDHRFYVNLHFQKEIGLFYHPQTIMTPATSATCAIAIGDVSGNNNNEIVLAYGGNRPGSKVVIFKKKGGISEKNIVFEQIVLGSYDCPQAVAIGNISGSKKNDDIIILHGGWERLGVYSTQGNGKMGEEDLYPIPYSHFNRQSLAVGDINGDGKNDVVIAHQSGLAILYHTP